MFKYYLHHPSGTILLPRGEIVVGRGLDCDLRFNDSGISRRHIRLLVEPEGVVAEDLGSKNGTLINGRPLVGRWRLAHGDELRMNMVELSLTIAQDVGVASFDDETQTFAGPKPRAPSGVVVPDQHTCPRCRTLVAIDAERCPRCGHSWTQRRPMCRTQELQAITEPGGDRRQEQRHRVHVPVLYRSPTLVFEGVAQDLTIHGMFVASEMLDPVATLCTIAVLPDGAPAAYVEGVVRHVTQESSLARPIGMGIEFTHTTDQAEQWLLMELARSDR